MFRNIELNLVRNRHLITNTFQTYIWENSKDPFLMKTAVDPCYYLHRNNKYVAALSFCEKDIIVSYGNENHVYRCVYMYCVLCTQSGLIFLQNSTLEIHPVPKRLHPKIMTRETLIDDNINNLVDKYPHIIRRASLNSIPSDFSATMYLPEEYGSALKVDTKRIGKLTVEVSFFFDEIGYKIFAPYFDYDVVKVRDMLLAYLNGVCYKV